VDAAHALADLTEISTQLESAVLATPDGSVVASSLADEARSLKIAGNAIELLRGAGGASVGAREPTQIHVATREGCVFVVRDDRHVLVAVTGPEPTVGLVFYDLKTSLRMVDEDQPKAKSKARRSTTKKSERAAADA
jgi:predicted regulator of Ras-like GTPase activity (Roadblock/LC7/MglB family)